MWRHLSCSLYYLYLGSGAAAGVCAANAAVLPVVDAAEDSMRKSHIRLVKCAGQLFFIS